MTAARERIAGLDIWSGLITIELLKGGLSNESYTVTSGTEKFVVRLGSDYPFHHVARDRELMTARAAHTTRDLRPRWYMPSRA
jgi:aminoglycoside phosphotransferase (APT) family kinase protein